MKTAKYRYCRLVVGAADSGGSTDNAFAVSSIKDDFLVAEVRMTDGISQLPAAEIEAYSGQRTMDYQELRTLLDSPARLTMRQRDGEKLTFSGKISQVQHLGLCHANPRFTPIFRYRLTLTSVLNDMRFVRQSRTFEKQNFESVIKAVLNYYKIDMVFRYTADDDFYSCQRDFYQRDESDYDFFRRVLFMAGWSFRIFTSSDKQQAQETILITDGNCFTNGDKDKDFPASVSGEEADGRIVVSQWRMESRTGIDSFTTDSGDFNGKEGERMWFLGTSGSLFANDADDSAAKQIAAHRMDSLNRLLAVDKQCYRGEATSLRLYPGCRITLSDFFGSSGPDINARITRLEYIVSDRLPEGYPGSIRPPDLNIRICGIDADDETVPLFTGGRDPDPMKKAAAGEIALTELTGVEETPAATGASAVFCATVCAKDGNCTAKANDVCTVATEENTNGVFFYAKLDGAAQASLVQFTMPLGGNGQGLYRLPRIGDRIVVTSSAEDRYILLCYIPTCKTMPFVDKDHIGNSQRMTVLRHNAPGAVPAYFATAADKPDPSVSKGFKYSEIGMYSNGSDEVMRLQTPGHRYDHAEKDHVSTARNFLFSTPNSNDGEFHIAKVNKIHLQADSEIRIQVGRSVLTFNEKMIELRVRQARGAGGPQDSVIYMNPMGVYLSASKINAVGQSRIDMEAGLGEVFSMSGGVMGLYARYVNLGTVDTNYMNVSRLFNGAMVGLNAVSFAVGITDDTGLNDRTYQTLVKNGSIDTDALSKLGASAFDFYSQFFYMGGGMTSSIVAARNLVSPHFATGDNTSNIFGAVLSLLDSIFSGVLSGLLLIPNLMARTLACDILLFAFAEAKYIYLLTRVGSIAIAKNQISYLRMAGEKTELWTKEVVMDTSKLDMQVYEIPLTAPVVNDADDGDIAVPASPIKRLTSAIARAVAADKAVGAEQELARQAARVKIHLDREDIKEISPSWWGDLDEFTLSSTKSIKVTLGSSEITIDSSGLKMTLSKLAEKVEQLEVQATQSSLKATLTKTEAESTQVKSQILQFE